MNLTEIFIEGYPADITADISALLTFSIDDIKDFSSRNTTYSKTIVLPGTSRNNAIFGNTFQINSANFYDNTLSNVNYNFNAAVSAKCYMFQGGIQVFKGVIRLLSMVNDNGFVEYECAVFGELGGLLAKISNNRLEDLDFSAYNHTYNTTNIYASWTAAKGSGYYYPLIDYGAVSTDKKNWDIKAFRPALYVKEYIDKIFAAAGYSYNCDLFNTNRFKSLIIPNNRKQLISLTNSVLTTTRTGSSHIIDSGTSFSVNLQMTSVSSSLFTASLSNSRFTYTGATAVNTNLSVSIYGGAYVGVLTGFTLVAKINGVSIPGTVKVLPVSGTTFPQNYTWSFNVPVTFNTGDYFELNYTSSASIFNGDYITATAASVSAFSLVAVESAINIGDTVKINDGIPKNILQSYFLASIIKMFNLYLYEDKDQSGVIYIKPYPDFFNASLSTVQDWTYKMDRSRPVQIKPMSELTSRYYLFKFKSDTDFYNDQYQKRYNIGYGDYKFDSNYEFSLDENTAEVIFSSTPLVGYTGESKVYPTIFKKSGTVEESIDSNIRIMQSYYVPVVPSWDLYNGTATGTGTIVTSITTVNVTGTGTAFTTQMKVGSRLYINGTMIGYIASIVNDTSLNLASFPTVATSTGTPFTYDNIIASYTDYPYAGHLDNPDAPSNDLNFAPPNALYFTLAAGNLTVNQFNVYWSPYMAEITDKDSKLITAYFRLTKMDIHNLDFSKYVFIDGNLFSLNKIEDYNASNEDICKATLIKVQDSQTTATSTPVDSGGDKYASYVATGTEGNTVRIAALVYANIIAVWVGDKLMNQVSSLTANDQYTFNTVRAKLNFLNNLEAGQIIHVLYKNS